MNSETPPATPKPPSAKRRNDAIIMSPEEAARIREAVAEREDRGEIPQRKAPETLHLGSPAAPEQARRQELLNGLNALLRNAQQDVTLASSRVTNLRHPFNLTLEGGRIPAAVSPADLETAENDLLGLNIRRDALRDAIAHVTSGTPLPADTMAIIDRIDAEAEQRLTDTAERAATGRATAEQVEYFREQLGAVRRLRSLI